MTWIAATQRQGTRSCLLYNPASAPHGGALSPLLADLLANRDYLLADGATGSNLMSMGLPPGRAPDLWNLEAPER